MEGLVSDGEEKIFLAARAVTVENLEPKDRWDTFALEPMVLVGGPVHGDDAQVGNGDDVARQQDVHTPALSTQGGVSRVVPNRLDKEAIRVGKAGDAVS